jgi:molybdopterin-containing oxidoreductase family iron-sulfur binding subunit
MGVNRRDFLRISGLGTLMGLGGVATQELLRPGQALSQRYLPDGKGLKAERWAMVIDTRKCLEEVEKSGCRDCMLACNRAHNIPQIPDPKHEIKWIWQEPYENTFTSQHHDFSEEALHGKPFLVLCNHCDKPPCVRVCPTQATFKREDGIVMMDYHRCIGCRYCMAAGPYGSRSFNFMDPRTHLDPATIDMNFPTRMKGVVEKCNFCAERLAEGLMPACVEACKGKAIIFGDLEESGSDVRKVLRSRYTIRRKPELGTHPEIFYIV